MFSAVPPPPGTPTSSGMNSGSYPKPFVPLRTKPTRPGHTPSNTAQRPPGRHTQMLLTNRAARFPSGTPASSSSSLSLLASSSPWRPQ